MQIVNNCGHDQNDSLTFVLIFGRTTENSGRQPEYCWLSNRPFELYFCPGIFFSFVI